MNTTVRLTDGSLITLPAKIGGVIVPKNVADANIPETAGRDGGHATPPDGQRVTASHWERSIVDGTPYVTQVIDETEAIPTPEEEEAIRQAAKPQYLKDAETAYDQFKVVASQMDPRSLTITTYALCGFANPGSMAIIIGGLSGIDPDRRGMIAKLGVKSLIAGTLAAFTTACIAGILL